MMKAKNCDGFKVSEQVAANRTDIIIFNSFKV